MVQDLFEELAHVLVLVGYTTVLAEEVGLEVVDEVDDVGLVLVV